MERPAESDRGYPEEQPAEVSDQPQAPAEDKPQRKAASGGAEHPGSGNEGDGTATGNPNAAGSDE
jgi:hypothetical protein